MTTHILWDVDGVFNPFLAMDLPERGFARFSEGWINWDLDLINHAVWMRELEKITNFVWASSWGVETNALIKWFHLDANSYPHIPLAMPALTGENETWKLPSVAEWVQQNISQSDKIIWVDDELNLDAETWAAQRGNILLVKPDPRAGFTLSQYRMVKDFIES